MTPNRVKLSAQAVQDLAPADRRGEVQQRAAEEVESLIAGEQARKVAREKKKGAISNAKASEQILRDALAVYQSTSASSIAAADARLTKARREVVAIEASVGEVNNKIEILQRQLAEHLVELSRREALAVEAQAQLVALVREGSGAKDKLASAYEAAREAWDKVNPRKRRKELYDNVLRREVKSIIRSW